MKVVMKIYISEIKEWGYPFDPWVYDNKNELELNEI